MKLSEKILKLRKERGMSQEDLAGKLNVSRQAVSRWEMGTAMPDAVNVLQLSKLFGVTTDYLLNEDYESDGDLPKVKKVETEGLHQLMAALVSLEVMVFILQFMAVVLLQSWFFGLLTFLPFVAVVGGFEYAYRKRGGNPEKHTKAFRRKFYKISAWLGTYFPIRFLMTVLAQLYPRPYNVLAWECVVLVVYIATVTVINLELAKLSQESSEGK